MFGNLGRNVVGGLSVIGYFLNTLFWVVPIIILSFMKLLPLKPWQRLVSYPLDACATNWISLNKLNQKLCSRTQFNVRGLDKLTSNDWYLVISNHQSWVDILVLQSVFNRKIPFLKFFLKKELIWVPFLGIAWWALDFPFMRRYSKAYLEKHPHLKGKDLETTRKACKKFESKPVSIMNFVEGTRFTQRKHDRQQSPFPNLLRPKAGGIAFVLSAMGERLSKLVDVTIFYPDGVPTYWDFVCGKVKSVHVNVNVYSIPKLFENGIFGPDYFDNAEQKARFHDWLNTMWTDKNQQLELMQKEATL
jgi:1-acyl-sn-glycerol-3-phosphate acyltransferase